MIVNRRVALAGLLSATAAGLPPASFALASETLPVVVVNKDPNCDCCGAWIDHLRTAGFPVEVIEAADIGSVKARLGVPQELASCHTAEVAGYLVEGHVPADALKRLLAEKPQAKGLAVPGMPVGAPGMEIAGFEGEPYEVVLFGPAGRSTFVRYQGAREL